jgi:hypothetical protein
MGSSTLRGAFVYDDRWIALLLTALMALVIGVLTLVPLTAPAAIPGSDKHHHLIALAALALPVAALAPGLLRILLPVLALYGVLIEILQPFVGRSGDPMDALADGLGLLIGSGLGLLLSRPLRRGLTRRLPAPAE